MLQVEPATKQENNKIIQQQYYKTDLAVFLSTDLNNF